MFSLEIWLKLKHISNFYQLAVHILSNIYNDFKQKKRVEQKNEYQVDINVGGEVDGEGRVTERGGQRGGDREGRGLAVRRKLIQYDK